VDPFVWTGGPAASAWFGVSRRDFALPLPVCNRATGYATGGALCADKASPLRCEERNAPYSDVYKSSGRGRTVSYRDRRRWSTSVLAQPAEGPKARQHTTSGHRCAAQKRQYNDEMKKTSGLPSLGVSGS
jgi:hypothetical protein